MKPYPKRIYLSAAWAGDQRPLVVQIATLIAEHGLTVVRDDERNKGDGDPFKDQRTWAQRVESMMRDCSGLVVVLPRTGKTETGEINPQMTSPFLIPEILAADAQNIPILLLADPNVSLSKKEVAGRLEVRFGNATQGGALLRADDIFTLGADQKDELETRIKQCGGFVLSRAERVTGPLNYPNNDNKYATKNAIQSFVEACQERDPYSFVFNVLPFSLKDTVHQTIASEVFKATGMACHISLDDVSGKKKARENWEVMLGRSDLVIAEMTSRRDACLFEAGCAVGMKKDFYLVSQKEQSLLPFGLDDQAFYKYETSEDLKSHVANKCCKAYRREVFNLSEEFKNDHVGKPLPGVPEWLDKKAGFSLDDRLTLSIWTIVLSAAVAVQIAVMLIWPSSAKPNALAVCSAASGFLAVTRVGREFWENKLRRCLKWLPWAGLGVLAALVMCLIYLMTMEKA